jgi:hypothetical protein
MATKNELIACMSQVGYLKDDIENAFSTENTAIKKSDELTKNLYILLWNSNNTMVGPLVKKVTNSIYSHASWSPFSTGVFYSVSAAKGFDKLFFEKNGAFAEEDLNTMANVAKSYSTQYYLYRIKVTETEYARATTIIDQQKDTNNKYSFTKLFSLGIRIIFKKNKDEFFKGYNDRSLSYYKFVCSTYTITSICQAVPRLIDWFRDNNFSITSISPKNIANIPGMDFLFQGNTLFEFDKWKKLYENKNGPLPN